MPKPLSDNTQRFIFGALVVVLVVFGIYLSMGGLGGSDGRDPQDGRSSGGSKGEEQGNAAPPSPIPTEATEDMNVLDWFPFEEDQMKSAAATAQAFAAAYGTIDYEKPQESYFKPLKDLATKDYAKTLSESSGAAALRGERAKKKSVSEGRASIDSIRRFDDKSITFVVHTQSITEDPKGSSDELGDFAITVVKEGGDWKVYDFQPADAANLGGG